MLLQHNDPHRESVLVVDDDESVRGLMARSLRLEGYAVAECGDAASALARLGAAAPEIAILDVNLPGSTGRELAERLRASRPGLRVLLVSGEPQDASSLPAGGPTSFILKPFGQAELLDALRKLLAA